MLLIVRHHLWLVVKSCWKCKNGQEEIIPSYNTRVSLICYGVLSLLLLVLFVVYCFVYLLFTVLLVIVYCFVCRLLSCLLTQFRSLGIRGERALGQFLWRACEVHGEFCAECC